MFKIKYEDPKLGMIFTQWTSGQDKDSIKSRFESQGYIVIAIDEGK